MIWLPTHLLLRVVLFLYLNCWHFREWFPPLFYSYFICLSHMFRSGAWFWRYKLPFLATRYQALLLFWRGEVTPWLIGVFWMPRVCHLVDSDAPVFHTGGLSYHNRFCLSNFENLPSFKNPTVALPSSLPKTSLFNFFLKSFPAISDLKFQPSSSSPF